MTKTVLITGTSSGVGLATSILLAKNGWKVIATMRDINKAAVLKEAMEKNKVKLTIAQLDITKQDSIDECFEMFADQNLDLLVNNAGIGHLGTLENETMEEIRQVMETNFFGTIQVTKTALPLLRKSAGSLISVSSILGVVADSILDAYSASKFAIEGFMESLAKILRNKNVKVTIVEPGLIDTVFGSNANPNPDTRGYEKEFQAYFELLQSPFYQSTRTSAETVAETILEVAKDANPPLRIQVGEINTKWAGEKLVDVTGNSVFKIGG